MRSEPSITVSCDRCTDQVVIELTPVARGVYAETDVDQQLKIDGWVRNEGEDICPECARDKINPSEQG